MCRLILLLYACISSELDLDCDLIRWEALVKWSSSVSVGEVK